MEFTTLAREIGFETNYPNRFNEDDLMEWLESEGVLKVKLASQPTVSEGFLDWFIFEQVESRYGRPWTRVGVSDIGVTEIKKLFAQSMSVL